MRGRRMMMVPMRSFSMLSVSNLVLFSCGIWMALISKLKCFHIRTNTSTSQRTITTPLVSEGVRTSPHYFLRFGSHQRVLRLTPAILNPEEVCV